MQNIQATAKSKIRMYETYKIKLYENLHFYIDFYKKRILIIIDVLPETVYI